MDLGTQRGLVGFSPYEQFLQIFLRGKSVKKLSMDSERGNPICIGNMAAEG